MRLGFTPNYAFNQTQLQRKVSSQPQIKPQVSFGEDFTKGIALGGTVGIIGAVLGILVCDAFSKDEEAKNIDLMQKDLKHTIELNKGVDPYKGFEVKDFTEDGTYDYQLQDDKGNRVMYDINKGTKTTTTADNCTKVENLKDIVE